MARLQEMAMAGGSKGLLLIALLAGLVAAVIVFVVVSEGDDSSGSVSSSVTPAVVAAQDIDAGTEITAEMVKVTDVPNDLLVTGSLEDTELVVGEVARVSILEGEQMTSARLGVAVPEKGIAGVIPVGKRAVAIQVDQITAVGGLLLPGDRIDVVRTIKVHPAGLPDDQYILRTETILQNVEVLSVAQEAQQASAQAGEDQTDDTTNPSYSSGEIPEDSDTQPNAATITVALDAAQSQKVVISQDSLGVVRVWGVQRAFGDDAITTIKVTEELYNEEDELIRILE